MRTPAERDQCRGENVPVRDAVCNAGVSRFRPIVLTAITTFAGLAPLLLEGSLSAQFLIPMATSLGFGVIFAAVISLLLVPAAYVILEDLQRLVKRDTTVEAEVAARETEKAAPTSGGREAYSPGR